MQNQKKLNFCQFFKSVWLLSKREHFFSCFFSSRYHTQSDFILYTQSRQNKTELSKLFFSTYHFSPFTYCKCNLWKLPMSAFCPWFWINCYQIINVVHSFNRDFKTYPDAQETCEKAALNGFKTGRLVEPKTRSFNDKVFTATNKFFGLGKSCWIGIRAKGESWVYTSSGTDIVFKNWRHNTHKKKHLRDCAYSIAAYAGGKGRWAAYNCNSSFKISFICEFV